MLSMVLLTAGFNVAAKPVNQERHLSLYNLHTEETLETTFWKNGKYNQGQLKAVSYFLRDYRTGQRHAVDKRLLNTLFTIQQQIGTQYPDVKPVFQVISGYRTPDTNDMLRERGDKVAKKSQHSRGKAIDIRVEGVPLEALRDIAWCLQKGGVGYYPEEHNNFVHVDVDRVRFWPAQDQKWKCMP